MVYWLFVGYWPNRLYHDIAYSYARLCEYVFQIFLDMFGRCRSAMMEALPSLEGSCLHLGWCWCYSFCDDCHWDQTWNWDINLHCLEMCNKCISNPLTSFKIQNDHQGPQNPANMNRWKSMKITCDLDEQIGDNTERGSPREQAVWQGMLLKDFKKEMRICPRWYAIPVNFLSLIAVLYVLAAALKFGGVLPDLNEQHFVFAVIRCPKTGVRHVRCLFEAKIFLEISVALQHMFICLGFGLIHIHPLSNIGTIVRPSLSSIWKVRLSHCFAIPHFFCSVFCTKRPAPSCRWGSNVDLQALKGKRYFWSMIHNFLQWTVFLMANLSWLHFWLGGQEPLDSLWLCQAASLWSLSFLEFMPPSLSPVLPSWIHCVHFALTVHADEPYVQFSKMKCYSRFYSI